MLGRLPANASQMPLIGPTGTQCHDSSGSLPIKHFAVEFFTCFAKRLLKQALPLKNGTTRTSLSPASSPYKNSSITCAGVSPCCASSCLSPPFPLTFLA